MKLLNEEIFLSNKQNKSNYLYMLVRKPVLEHTGTSDLDK